VIVANKLDLVNERQVSAEAVKELSKRWQIPVYETSAKRNWQVAAVFEDLVKQMRNCYPTEQLKQRKRKRDKLCLIM
jgi:putative ribosome biogenesis GTPase RsgA